MKKLLCAALAVGLLAVVTSMRVGAQGTAAKVHAAGKDKLVVESGGEIEVKSGGTLTLSGTLAGSGTVDTSKITSGAFTAARIGSGSIDTTKLNAVVTPATGTLLCYTNDGKMGKVTAVVDTGKTGTCAAF